MLKVVFPAEKSVKFQRGEENGHHRVEYTTILNTKYATLVSSNLFYRFQEERAHQTIDSIDEMTVIGEIDLPIEEIEVIGEKIEKGIAKLKKRNELHQRKERSQLLHHHSLKFQRLFNFLNDHLYF